jgi:error-prone DNA polymerase
VRENGGCNPSQVEAADNSDGSTLTQPSPCPGEGSQTADSIGNRQSAIGNPKSTWGLHGPAVRLGFRLIKGLRQADIDRLVAARNRLPDRRFTSIEQVQREAKLSKRLVEKLAEADAFGSLGRTRRPALWEAMALDDVQRPLFEMRNAERGMRNESDGERISETVPSWADDQQETVGDSSFTISHSPFGIPPMPLGQEVLTDYNTAGLSLKTHPVALVRETLAKQKITRAVELPETPAGKWVRVCGLVLIRQRPGTASGIVFVTLEDETGVVNLIVRPRVFDRYRPAARHAALLQCEGYVEKQGQVIHVMAKRLFDRSDLLAGVSFYSRDFH